MPVKVPDPIEKIESMQGQFGAYPSIVKGLEEIKEYILWERKQHYLELVMARAEAGQQKKAD